MSDRGFGGPSLQSHAVGPSAKRKVQVVTQRGAQQPRAYGIHRLTHDGPLLVATCIRSVTKGVSVHSWYALLVVVGVPYDYERAQLLLDQERLKAALARSGGTFRQRQVVECALASIQRCLLHYTYSANAMSQE